MNRSSLLSSLLASLLVASVGLVACGDEESGSNNASDAGTTDTSDPGPGAAYEVDAEVSGSSNDTQVDGTAEAAVEGQYSATLADGTLTIALASSDGTAISVIADVATHTVPGAIAVDRELDTNAYVNITTPLGSWEGASGTLTLNQCPNAVGVVTGSFDNIGLISLLTEAADGTFDGSWRVTMVATDGSASCEETPVETDTGVNTDTGGGDPVCTYDTCDGPCCPYVEPMGQCQLACFTTDMDCAGGFDMEACMACFAECPESTGLADDAACNDLYADVSACEEASACDPFGDDDVYESCMLSNCCDEVGAAF